jgi:hypothetical protein
MTTRLSLKSQKFGMMHMELHDERGIQHPPPSVHVDTERATHKLNVARLINSHRISNPQEMGYPYNDDNFSPNSQKFG